MEEDSEEYEEDTSSGVADMPETNESEKTAHYFVFSGDNKAGMHGYEKVFLLYYDTTSNWSSFDLILLYRVNISFQKKQAQIIYDMSKNSSFFKQAEKQDEKRKVKIKEIKKKVEQYMNSKNHSLLSTSSEKGGNEVKHNIMKLVDSHVTEYEAQRDLETIKVVVDMDMFFAAVAIRDRPHLKDKPVAIGGNTALMICKLQIYALINIAMSLWCVNNRYFNDFNIQLCCKKVWCSKCNAWLHC
jgi:hypothetical protein